MAKKIGKIVLLFLLFCFGFTVGIVTKYYIDDWRAKRNVAYSMDLLDPFKNDKYGGATPEETFDLYLSALKKGDLELASRYFYVTKQEGELKSLQEMKERGELVAYIEELSSVKKEDWEKGEGSNGVLPVRYKGYRNKPRIIETFDDQWNTVQEKLPVGNFNSAMSFRELNNIWKIYSL